MIQSRYFTVDCDFELCDHYTIDEADLYAKAQQQYDTTPFRIDFDTETKQFTIEVCPLPKPEYWFTLDNGLNGIFPAQKTVVSIVEDVYVKNTNGGLDLLTGKERDDAIKAITSEK